ncbi:hypothetical protein [Pseudomonas chlororaphis]|nr:hypothetical protein [Pseudomonas chlororaphis]
MQHQPHHQRRPFPVLWPGSRHRPPKLRVFVDFLSERLVLGCP